MDKPISVGDLAVVVKPTPCCGNTEAIGYVFRVLTVAASYGRPCCYCGTPKYGISAEGPFFYFTITRLKRIPPLEELDDVKKNEEITA